MTMRPCPECNGWIHLEVGADGKPGIWQHVQYASEARPPCNYSERERRDDD
jgi:hypothetical protein